MKILILGTAYPLRGGIAHYLALLASRLRVRHVVEMITFKRQYPKLLFPGKTQEEQGAVPSVEPAPQLIDSINPFNWLSVAAYVRKRKPDLLIFKYWIPFFGPCFGTIARLVRKDGHTRVLYICDNILPHESRPGDRMFTRYAFRQADYFIVQSDEVEKQLLDFWPGAVYRKVPHPVYDMFGPPVPKQEARARLGVNASQVLLFFGYVRAYKGLDLLLRSLSIVLERADVHLLIVGEFYDDEQKYRDLITALRLGKNVTVVSDYVGNDRVAPYFCAADAVVLPYVSATQSGIAQIAYNFDTPVIATNVGGLAEVVRDGVTGYIVPPNDAEALANGILRFFAEHRGAEFAANVRVEKKRYSWEALVTAIEEMAVR